MFYFVDSAKSKLTPVLMQIGGEWLVAGGTSAEVTGDEGMFSLGTSQLVFLAGNVLQVGPSFRQHLVSWTRG